MDSSSILSCLLSQNPNVEDIRIAHDWFKRKTEVFNDLSFDTINDILRAAKIIEKYPNEIIIRQGDNGDCFYVLLSGNASVYISTDFTSNIKDEQQEQGGVITQSKLIKSARSGNVQKLKLEMKKTIKESDRRLYGEFIKKYVDGNCFGELALIQSENIRNATIIAEEKCHLLSISRELFDKAIRSYAEFTYKEKINFVNSHFLFNNWTPRFKHQVAMSLIKMKANFGEDITVQGRLCNGLLLIKKGSAKIIMDLKQHYAQYTTYVSQMNSSESQCQDLIISAKEENKSARYYKENILNFRRDKIEIAIIGNNDLIGDIEFGFTFPTNLYTVTASELCEIYLLENVNIERMINTKRNSRTFEMIHYLAKLKLNAYYERCFVFDNMPLLRALLEEISIEDEGTFVDYIEKQTTKSSLVPIFKTGPIIDFYGPGSVFFRNRQKRKITKDKDIKKEHYEKSRNRQIKPNTYFNPENLHRLGTEIESLHKSRKSMSQSHYKKNTFIDWETSSQHLNDLEERLHSWMSKFTLNGRSKTEISIHNDIRRLPRFKNYDLPEECRFILKYKKINIESGDEAENRNGETKDEDNTFLENGKKTTENRIRQYTELEYSKLKEEMKLKEKRLSIFRLKHSI